MLGGTYLKSFAVALLAFGLFVILANRFIPDFPTLIAMDNRARAIEIEKMTGQVAPTSVPTPGDTPVPMPNELPAEPAVPQAQ